MNDSERSYEEKAALLARAVPTKCEEMGEAAVLADLERPPPYAQFKTPEQRYFAIEWIHAKRLTREEAQNNALKTTARYTIHLVIATLVVALATFFVALFSLRH